MEKQLQNLKKAQTILNNLFVERKAEVEGLILSMLAKTHLLLLGSPGTAKSQLVMTWSKMIKNARYFQWLLTKYTTPEELFGPFSLQALERDEYIRKTTYKAPEAHFIFLDEIWKANSGVLNATLTLINERLFYNGPEPTKVPLITLVGASNELPEEEDNLNAMLDRFILKYHVKPIVEKENFIKMLTIEIPEQIDAFLSLEDIQHLQGFLNNIKISDSMFDLYILLRKNFHSQGIINSDRTYKQVLQIVKASALINGRDEVVEDDFEVLKHALWNDPKDQNKLFSIILNEINPDRNKILELYETATEVYDKLMAIQDDAKRIKEGIDVAIKLKEIKKKIHEYYKTLKQKNKNIDEAVNMENKIEEYLTNIYNYACGVKF